MKNIWLIFGTMVFVAIGCIWVIVEFTVKRYKHYVIYDLLAAATAIMCLVFDYPYMKDLVNNEPTQIVGVYLRYERKNVHPGAYRLFFEVDDKNINLLAPIVTKMCVEMEFGKTYLIEYYPNCKVIKSYAEID